MYKTRLDVEPFHTLAVRPTKGRPRTLLPEQDLLFEGPGVITYWRNETCFIYLSTSHLSIMYTLGTKSSNTAGNTNFLPDQEEEYIADG